MGYTRVVQYGDITQIYQYSREYHYKERYISPTEKKRKKKSFVSVQFAGRRGK